MPQPPKPTRTDIAGFIGFLIASIIAIVLTIIGISVPWGSSGDLSHTGLYASHSQGARP